MNERKLIEQLTRLNDKLEALTPTFNTIWKTSEELAAAIRDNNEPEKPRSAEGSLSSAPTNKKGEQKDE